MFFIVSLYISLKSILFDNGRVAAETYVTINVKTVKTVKN